MSRDSIGKTFGVTIALCVVCSSLVALAAVSLKERQDLNKKLDKQKNVLFAAGLAGVEAKNDDIAEIFEKRIVKKLLDLNTGQFATQEQMDELGITDLDKFNAESLAKFSSKDKELAKKHRILLKEEGITDIASLKTRENFSLLYFVRSEDGKAIETVIFPVKGKGLWSTLLGFIAVDLDLNTVRGITFYSHAETPGLGGEVDNFKWKATWEGKQIFATNGTDEKVAVALGLVKGSADKENPHEIDGLSGATLTANGVTNLVKFWFGENGFQKFIQAVQKDPTIISDIAHEKSVSQKTEDN
ncbi:MAG: Na(+)-translocating NADH-quinone reductase subunit C [Pirellulaceae bacterium]|nr:Na(+)-translocating NADH-quinone reductase subunit C [Pirellulaceae bacterium]